MEISNLSDAEFKTLVTRMLKELSGFFNSIEMIQSEMKETLIDMNNLQGINSSVDEAENQINDLEHKEAKINQSEQQEENRIQENEDSVSSLWDSFKHSHHRSARRGRKSKKLEICLKNNERKLP